MEMIHSAESGNADTENMSEVLPGTAIDMAGELIGCSGDQVFWPTWDAMVLEGDLGYQSSF